MYHKKWLCFQGENIQPRPEEQFSKKKLHSKLKMKVRFKTAMSSKNIHEKMTSIHLLLSHLQAKAATLLY